MEVNDHFPKSLLSAELLFTLNKLRKGIDFEDCLERSEIDVLIEKLDQLCGSFPDVFAPISPEMQIRVRNLFDYETKSMDQCFMEVIRAIRLPCKWDSLENAHIFLHNSVTIFKGKSIYIEAVFFTFHLFWDKLKFNALLPKKLSAEAVTEYLKHYSTSNDIDLIGTEVARVLEAKYVDELGLLLFFKDYIENANRSSNFFSKNSGNQSEYFSSVVAVCQRSGSGKTRLILEMGRRFFPLVYISLGSLLESPNNIGDFLKVLRSSKENRPKAEWRALIFFTTLLKFVLDEYGKWLRIRKEIYSHLLFFAGIVSRFQPVGDQEKNKTLQSLWGTILEEVAKNSADGNYDWRKIVQDYKESGLPKLVVAIDEAKILLNDDSRGQLVSSFRILRKALSTCADKPIDDGIVTLIVADTCSKITNFKPIAYADISGRDVDEVGTLIPPFFLLSGHDIMAKTYLEQCRAIWAEGENARWSEILAWRDEDCSEFIKLGSALWGAFLDYKGLDGQAKAYLNLVQFASRKLQGHSPEASSIHYIAALSARMSLTIIPRSNLAKDLVAGSMAQLDVLLTEGDSVFVRYPSDVILAQAAAKLIQKAPSVTFQTLDDYTSNFQIAMGDGGECVVEMLLLAAIDNLETSFKSVLVKDYIECLFGETVGKAITTSLSEKPILKGKMFFNHFIKLTSSASVDNVAYAFARGAAIAGYSSQIGWDLCIPVCLEDGRLTAIFVQVKNYDNFMPNSSVIPIMQKMRLAGLFLFNPKEYKAMQIVEKQKKLSNVMLRKRIPEITGDSQSLEDLSLNFLFNLLQGGPLPEDAKDHQSLPVDVTNNCPPHVSSIQPCHNFVGVQGFSSYAFPNFWGQTKEMRHECISLVQRLLVPRQGYTRQLARDYNRIFVEKFYQHDHPHARNAFEKQE